MKLKILLTILLCVQQVVFAQTYIVSQTGTIRNIRGNIQQNKVTYNYYNNYYAQNYVNNKVVNNGNINNIEIVMDFSSSMEVWVEEAKNTMAFILNQIPKTTKVGLRVFGQEINYKNPHKTEIYKYNSINSTAYNVTLNKTDKISSICTATAQVANISPVNYNTMINSINNIEIGIATPLVYALKRTIYSDFAYIPQTERKKIVLITDGRETCGEDPCAFAKNLNRNDIIIDVVLISSFSKELMCLTERTNGNFYTLTNPSDFSKVVSKSITTNDKQNNSQQYNQSYEYIRN